MYELYINKEKIGNQVLSPTISDYTKRVYYNVFDVAKNLSSNKNTVGVVLGNGRFFSIRPGEVDEHIPNEADEWKIQPSDLGQIVVDLLKMNPNVLPGKIEVRPTKAK